MASTSDDTFCGSDARKRIAIVGGGFTGAAIAYHLAQARTAAEIVVFEPRPRLGAGLAYGGADRTHRINVPASRMSMAPRDETHFTRWLQTSGLFETDAEAWAGGAFFARRQDFGRYVDEVLQPFVASGAIVRVRQVVDDVGRLGNSWRLRARSGESFAADVVIIATTHPAPSPPRELLPLAGDARLIGDGIADGALANISADNRVLIVGAGLTAADLVASLDARGHRAKITLTSRRGLRSKGHPRDPFPAEGDFVTQPASGAAELLARIRRAIKVAEAAGRSWHPVLDAVRTQGGDIWAALPPEARRRVVRHLRPFWDVHRFRAAPQIEAVLDRKFADASLELVRGRLNEVVSRPDGLYVDWRNGRGQISGRSFDRIIVATGPAHGGVLDAQGYLRSLAQQGFVALDATGLGLQASRQGRAVGTSGVAEPTLFVAGPLARGTFGELMGLPHVAVYAEFIAEQAALLVGSEDEANASQTLAS
jgi:uncharacterized NAD(P)/FAD-binding protein YdhS